MPKNAIKAEIQLVGSFLVVLSDYLFNLLIQPADPVMTLSITAAVYVVVS